MHLQSNARIRVREEAFAVAQHDHGFLTKTLLVMKITAILLLAAVLQVSAKGKAQTVTYSAKSVPLATVFAAIETQTGYAFFYRDEDLSKGKPVSVNLHQVPIEQALMEVLAEQALKFTVKGKTILITAATSAADLSPQLSFQAITAPPVTGVVRGSGGQPLAGATIRVKGKNTSVASDEHGRFNIYVEVGSVLIISYVGFKQREFRVESTDPLNIIMHQNDKSMDTTEVVFSTGYQNIPKERATGSFVQLDNAALNRKVSTNILDRIYEITSGLNYDPKSAGGGGRMVTIRGNSTINANPRPLIVVDGFPYDESASFDNIVNNLNPNDVENITVLKDAAAASIWGARAGNGVIVITTKKGKYNQDINISINSNVSIKNKPDLFSVSSISSKDLIGFEKDRFADSIFNEYDDIYPAFNLFPTLSPAIEILLAKRSGKITEQEADKQLSVLENHDVRNDINQYLLQRSVNQQYALNLSGGTNKYNFYSSLGYDNNRPNSVGDKQSRLTVLFKNSYSPIKNLELNAFLNYTQGKNVNNSVGYATLSPYTRLIDEQGNPLAIPANFRSAYVDTASYPALMDWHNRPLDELNLNDRMIKSSDARFGAGIRYRVIRGLNASIDYQYQRILTNSSNISDVLSYNVRDLVNTFMYRAANGSMVYPVPNGGIVDRTSVERNQWNVRGSVNFDRKFDKHYISAIAGAESREVTSSYSGYRQYGYDPQTGTVINNLDFLNTHVSRPSESAQNIPNSNGSVGGTLYRYVSYFSNGSYTYDQRYTFSASARLDGSNFFGVKANQRVVPLWSIGGLWNISKESFYNTGWLPVLKLRATFGYQGNTNNSATAYATMNYRNGNSVFNNRAQYGIIGTPPNPQLRWEKVRMLNLGLDFQSKNNRLVGSIEYYKKNGVDLLGPILVDPTTGFSTFTGNRASMKGSGWDVNLNRQNLTGKVKWDSKLLFSYNQDEITSYENGSTRLSASNYFGGLVVVGKPLSPMYSYKWAGLDPVNGDPRGYIGENIEAYNSVYTEGKPEDVIYHGSLTPKFFGSFINTLSYHDFSLSFNVLFRFDYYFRRTSVNYGNLLNNSNPTGHGDFEQRWQNIGDEAHTDIPSAILASNTVRDLFYQRSEVLVEKGDHIRLQDIKLNYNLSKHSALLLPFKQVNLFLLVDDVGLILWRANKYGIDPLYGDLFARSYRNVSFGLNVNF